MFHEKLAIVYFTTRNMAQAETIVSVLLDERLIVSANIIPGSMSYFRWEGKIDRQEEVIVLAKTRDSLYPSVQSRVKNLHTYQKPSLLKIKVEDALPLFQQWTHEATGNVKVL